MMHNKIRTVNRRLFLKNTLKTASGIVFLGKSFPVLSSYTKPEKYEGPIRAFIPMPIQVVIDDVGWWSGEDGSQRQEPYRTGINRNHVPADYQAIAELGKALGIRPQAAFILCEWDKENILRNVPTSTWMGRNWDNSKWIGPWLEEAADIIRNNKEYFELTLHGIGHEYWENGKFTRAEWTDSNGQMRPDDQVEIHLDYFGKLMDQHKLGPFPKSFVPAAFRHSFGPSSGRKVSLAQLLEKRGINYINTPFSSVYNKERIQYEHFGFDSGVITIDRGNDEFPWLTFPANPQAELTGPTCGMHWPNLLHPDPGRNLEIVELWINYLKPYNNKPDMMLASDSVSFQHQLVHNSLTRIQVNGNKIDLDFTETAKLPGDLGKKGLTIKISTIKPMHFRSEGLEIKKQSLQEGSQYLYILSLDRNPVELKASIRVS